MRLVTLVIALVALTAGCTRKPTLEPLPPAVATPKEVALTSVGSTLDVIDSRVAAAVTIAREANTAGKPAIVESELSVAASFLPKASEEDVAYARQRTSGTAADYEAQRKKAAEKQKAAEAAWADLEKQVAANKAALALRDARIVELTKEVEAVRKEGSRNLWSLGGVAVAVCGALAFAFTGPRIGLPLLACGAAMGAFPFVVESPHFDLIVTITLGCGAALLLWLAWDFIRDRVNAKPPQE